MTALDIFREYDRAAKAAEAIEEKIQRREAMATGATAKPLTADGGSRGGGDASMRLAEYVGNIEDLREQLRAAKARLDDLKACCVYLAEQLPAASGDYLLRRYVGRLTLRACAKALNCSETQARRIREEAERAASALVVLAWDGKHVPVLSAR